MKDLNIIAIIMFLLFVLATLGITYWAAKRTKTAKDFYTAGGGITGFQNGLAMSGDYMSAASFLGISGLVYLGGFDAIIYSVGFLVGWPVFLFLIAEKLRNLGKYTFADVASYRLKKTPIRILSGLGSIATVLLYLTAQLVGSGKLISILFSIPYEFSIILIGIFLVVLVSFGGMLATTWVQIVKAILLLVGTTILAFMIMNEVGFSLEELFKSADYIRKADNIMSPGGIVSNPISVISLGIALMFGTSGLPHILMRFFTVSDTKEARKSVFYATSFIGYFYILIFFIGFGAIVLVSQNPEYLDMAKGTLLGGNNMAAIHLSHVVGGNIFFGFICAVAFVTILAVVSGLTLSGASAISHDLYMNIFAKNKTNVDEMRVHRLAVIGIGIFVIFSGLIFANQNIAHIVGLAFAVAATVNFPILFLSIYWSKLTTRGAVIGGTLGMITVGMLITFGPSVWGEIINGDRNAAIFPYDYPALFSVAVSFISIWFFSITDKSDSAKKEIEAFEDQYVRSQTGIGADGAVSY